MKADICRHSLGCVAVREEERMYEADICRHCGGHILHLCAMQSEKWLHKIDVGLVTRCDWEKTNSFTKYATPAQGVVIIRDEGKA